MTIGSSSGVRTEDRRGRVEHAADGSSRTLMARSTTQGGTSSPVTRPASAAARRYREQPGVDAGDGDDHEDLRRQVDRARRGVEDLARARSRGRRATRRRSRRRRRRPPPRSARRCRSRCRRAPRRARRSTRCRRASRRPELRQAERRAALRGRLRGIPVDVEREAAGQHERRARCRRRRA